MSKRPLIGRTVIILSMVSLFTDMASEMVYPVLPAYLAGLGMSMGLIGVLEGIAQAVAGLSKGYFGQLSDRSGKRAMFVQMGYGLSAFSKGLLAVWVYPWWILIARTSDRLGKGLRTGARDAILADAARLSERGRVFGFHRAMDTLGAALGPLVALLWLYLRPGDYRGLFLVAVAPGVIALILTFRLSDPPDMETAKGKRPGPAEWLAYLKRSGGEYRRLLGGLLFFGLINSSDFFLLLLAGAKGVSVEGVILLYVMYNLVYAALSYPAGVLADRFGPKRMMVFGYIVFAGVYAGMAFADETWQLTGLFAVYGLYAAATDGVSKAWIANVALPKEKATAIGTWTALGSMATLGASAGAGFIWDAAGPEWLFGGTACAALTAALYFTAFTRSPRG